MAEIKKPQSGIIGQATVVFGGAIKVEYGNPKQYPASVVVAMGELIHPCAKQGQEPKSNETYMDNQVHLVFPDLESLAYFRDEVLGNVESALKDVIRKRVEEAELQLDFFDVIDKDGGEQ